MANQEGTAQHRAAKETGDKFAGEWLENKVAQSHAAKIPAGVDTPTMNAEKAKREGWNDSGSSREREGEKK